MTLATLFHPATPATTAAACLLLLAGACKAAADAQAHGSPRLARWFPRWAGPESWRLKYRGGEPAGGPAFPLATTVLVGLTDLWHFSNLATYACLDAALLLLTWPTVGRWWALAGIVGRRVVFEPLYRWLRKPIANS